MVNDNDAHVASDGEGGYFYTYPYPRPAVTVDLIVVAEEEGKDSHMLFVRRGKEPHKGKLALPGGFLNMDETSEQAAKREFREECSAELPEGCQVHFHSVADRPDRDPRGRVISLVHVAMYDGAPFTVKGADDAVEALWMPISSLRDEDFAFDHADIVRNFLNDHPWLTEECSVCRKMNCIQHSFQGCS